MKGRGEQEHLLMGKSPKQEAARAGNATRDWKKNIAEGVHKQDIEKATQQEKPKL